ncbi:hypothetical protein [uncultured Alistipes sp.]|uniref:hypothetical protein n=1 Tax=uncultured Alistipes sp. TaxID=538949 RepID=UPI00261E52AC|nr:hypothetical protein [uncultured Alistipes sp.]
MNTNIISDKPDIVQRPRQEHPHTEISAEQRQRPYAREPTPIGVLPQPLGDIIRQPDRNRLLAEFFNRQP